MRIEVWTKHGQSASRGPAVAHEEEELYWSYSGEFYIITAAKQNKTQSSKLKDYIKMCNKKINN